MMGRGKKAAAAGEFRCANASCNVTGRKLVNMQCALWLSPAAAAFFFPLPIMVAVRW